MVKKIYVESICLERDEVPQYTEMSQCGGCVACPSNPTNGKIIYYDFGALQGVTFKDWSVTPNNFCPTTNECVNNYFQYWILE